MSEALSGAVGQREVATGPDPAASRPPVHSWDEFTQLREVIVGDATHARIPCMTDPSAWMACFPSLTPAEVAEVRAGEFPRHVIEETNEDLAALVETLQGLGVTTHRPPAVDHSRSFRSPHWSADGYLSYCPRDITLIVGSTIIEAPSPMRSRYFELFNLRGLFQDYLLRGAGWLSAPRPQLRDELFGRDEKGRPLLHDDEPAFDAANVLRLGRDLIYLVSRSGNEMGLTWLQSTLRMIGDVRVHPMRHVYGYTHVDTTLGLLRPGLVLANPERVRPDQIPEPLRGWDVIWCPRLAPQKLALPHPLGSRWIGMNLLMVNPELAIADAEQPELIAALERHRITVLPHRLRHAQLLGGGFHCVTLDVVRDGGCEDYLG